MDEWVPAFAGPLHNSGARPRSWQERIRSNPFAELSNPDCLPGIPNLSPEDGRPELCNGPAKVRTHSSGVRSVERWGPAFAFAELAGFIVARTLMRHAAHLSW